MRWPRAGGASALMPFEISASNDAAVARLKQRLSGFETEEGRRKGLAFQPGAGDVFVCTTPKVCVRAVHRADAPLRHTARVSTAATSWLCNGDVTRTRLCLTRARCLSPHPRLARRSCSRCATSCARAETTPSTKSAPKAWHHSLSSPQTVASRSTRSSRRRRGSSSRTAGSRTVQRARDTSSSSGIRTRAPSPSIASLRSGNVHV